jgi:hypothetical protein
MIVVLDEKEKRLFQEVGFQFDPDKEYTESELDTIEGALDDLLMESFGPGFSETPKSESIEDLTTYLSLLRRHLLN